MKLCAARTPAACLGPRGSEKELPSPSSLVTFWLAVPTSPRPADAGKEGRGTVTSEVSLEDPCPLSLGVALSLTLRDGEASGPLHRGGLLTWAQGRCAGRHRDALWVGPQRAPPGPP